MQKAEPGSMRRFTSKYPSRLVLLVPAVCAVFAVTGYGFFFRAAVSASCAVVLLLFPEKFAGNSIRRVVAALPVSIGGDWFMSHVGSFPTRLICGICLFLAAHVCFVCFCMKNGRIHRRVLLFVSAGYFVFFFVALFPAVSQIPLLLVVPVYLPVSCVSISASVGLRLWPGARRGFVPGIALLVFSDTLIAMKIFAGRPEFDFLILPACFASHMMIALALMRNEALRL